ncbi:hypothetical protein PVAG01_04111 [Phlyctema vagabunda]|uniref:Zn(2)-C6 fungal-type domain-containing protein n=1 Tax=Phlyctema vagabunda TaxID=108571 RepID=A0ABR4PNC8_9HELO
MAVSHQHLPYSTSSMWNMGGAPHTYGSGPEMHPTSMAYQYPPLSAGLDPASAMMQNQHGYSTMHSPLGPSPSPTTSKHRTGSVTSKSAKIKRALSTPNVRGQASADAAALAMSSAEKRRNKLGYHRTSMACGHCRRRKIRCIPSAGDAQNRCANCIRLKKECNFVPVDQQHQDSSRRSSKAQSGTGQVSESSSPSTSSVHLPELQTNLQYTHLTMAPIEDVGGSEIHRQRTASYSPEIRGLNQSRTFDYGSGSTGWMSSDAPSPATKMQPEMASGYWRGTPQESPITPSFGNYATNIQIPPPQNWPGQNEQSPREEIAWSAGPQRSTSYGNLEGLSSQQYAAYSQQPPHHIADNYTTKPRMMQSNIYPPPLSSSVALSGPENTPQHSAGPISHPPYQAWGPPQQQQQHPHASQPPYGFQHGGAPPQFEASNGTPHYGYGDSTGIYPAPAHHGR